MKTREKLQKDQKDTARVNGREVKKEVTIKKTKKKSNRSEEKAIPNHITERRQTRV